MLIPLHGHMRRDDVDILGLQSVGYIEYLFFKLTTMLLQLGNHVFIVVDFEAKPNRSKQN